MRNIKLQEYQERLSSDTSRGLRMTPFRSNEWVPGRKQELLGPPIIRDDYNEQVLDIAKLDKAKY